MSTWSPCLSVPASSWAESPASAIARSVPCSCARGPVLDVVREPAERHLLAGVDRRRRHEVLHLVGVRDRAGHDGPLDDLRRRQHVVLQDVRAGRADGDVALRDEDRDGALAVLHVPLVVGDVEQREHRRGERKPGGDDDVADAIGHGGVCFLFVRERDQSTRATLRTPRSGMLSGPEAGEDPLPDDLGEVADQACRCCRGSADRAGGGSRPRRSRGTRRSSHCRRACRRRGRAGRCRSAR